MILGHHATHIVRARGAHRLWHSGHLLMAIGMAYMILPLEYRALLSSPPRLLLANATVLFAVAAILAFGFAVLKLFEGIGIDLPWVTLTAGLGIMAYMLAGMAGEASAPLTYGAAIWCGLVGFGWFTGELCGRPDARWLPPAVGPLGGAPRATAARYLAGTTPIAYHAGSLSRATLGLMAVGMAYMLAAMQRMS